LDLLSEMLEVSSENQFLSSIYSGLKSF